MTLGQRIKAARLEAGLSQRQLCGDEITRNMLSQIENGSAHPSMATLRFLSARLGKPISFFLEENTVTSANQQQMQSARQAYAAGAYEDALAALRDYRAPDPVFDYEQQLLTALCRIALAKTAIQRRKYPYAAQLLNLAADAGKACPYWRPEQERERLLLLAQTRQVDLTALAANLPADDRELLLRSEAALQEKAYEACARYLNAAQDKESAHWHFLRAEAFFMESDYTAAATHYHKAELAYPAKTAARLEVCYRELGNFQQAYHYACKQR